MTITVPFKFIPSSIAAALGDSVIYEEYKGDFAQAAALAEAQLQRARMSEDPTILADALLARGIVHLLQGDLATAHACFREIDESLPNDFDRRLRASSYARLATIWQYSFLPDGNSTETVELKARRGLFFVYDPVEDERHKTIFEQAHAPLSRFESAFVHDFFKNLQNERSSFQTINRMQMPEEQLDEVMRKNTLMQTQISEELRQEMLGMNISNEIRQRLSNIFQFRQMVELYNGGPALLAFVDLATADLYRRLGKMPLAQQFLDRALQIAQQSGDLAAQGSCYLCRGDWLAAPFSTPLVWNFSIEESNTGSDSLVPLTEDQEFSQQGADLACAATAYTEAERLFQDVGAQRGMVQLLLRRCYVAMLTEDFTSAANFAQQAQATAEHCGDRLAYWLAQAQRLLCRIGIGEYPEESATAEKIGAWGATAGSFSYALGLGLFFGRVGHHWLIRRGDYERSLACYRLAAATFKALGATVNLAQSLTAQAAVYEAVGETKSAIVFYEQALDHYIEDAAARPSLDETLYQRTLWLAEHLCTHLCYGNEDPNTAERAVTRLRKLTELPAEAGNQPTGMKQALAGLMRIFIEPAIVAISLGRAKEVRNAGDLARAEQLFAEAMHAVDAIDDPAKCDFLRASVFAAQNLNEAAKQAFKQYLTQGGANSGAAHAVVSTIQDTNSPEYQRMVAMLDAETHQEAVIVFGRLKAFTEAKEHLDLLVREVGPTWWASSERPWRELSDCAVIYEGLNDLDQALVYCDEAIAALETRRSRLSREELKTALAGDSNVQYLYFQAARTALKQAAQAPNNAAATEWASRALAYIERGKARALLDLMASSAMVAGSSRSETDVMRAWRSANAQLALWRGLLAKERSRSDANAQQIAQLSQQIEEAAEALRAKEEALAQADPTFYRTVNVQGEVISLAQIQAALPAQTALLEYAALGDDLLIWAITKEGIAVQRHLPCDAKALEREVRTYHRACMDPAADTKMLEEQGKTLAETLLAPMATALCACPNLIIVPYGAAYTLPFHALPWAGEPLGASHTVSYLPSASALQFVRPGVWPSLPEQILAVGNPHDMAYRPPLGSEAVCLPPLSGAEDEATYVASLFSAGQVLTGRAATEATVSALVGRYPLLHFATHGLLLEEAPLLSSLLLADGEALCVYELMGLHLNADLVVLSACRTALGEITHGDEVIGLTRGLLGAGARAALVSLWPVNDVSTSLLMGEFYRQLRLSRSPAIALQSAQNYLRQLTAAEIAAEVGKLKDAGYARDAERTGITKPAPDYRHPHFWAPFVLMG